MKKSLVAFALFNAMAMSLSACAGAVTETPIEQEQKASTAVTDNLAKAEAEYWKRWLPGGAAGLDKMEKKTTFVQCPFGFFGPDSSRLSPPSPDGLPQRLLPVMCYTETWRVKSSASR